MSQRVGPMPQGTAHPSSESGAAGPPRPVYRPWEEVYPSLPPERQHELCALAQHQGFLLADQIPLLPVDPIRAKLADIFQRTLPPLPLLAPAASTVLDPAQRDALQRALHAPDITLVVGPPGTGKQRLAHELIQQACANGQRVLLLATDAPALDASLVALAAQPGVHLTRLIGAHEQAANLPPEIVRLTAHDQERVLRAELDAHAHAELNAAEQERHTAATTRDQWSALHAALQEQSTAQAEYDAILTRRDGLLAEVQRDAEQAVDPVPYFVQRLRGAATAHEKKLAPLATDEAALAQERAVIANGRATLEAEVNDLRHKAEGAKSGLFSTGFWKAKFDKSLPNRLTESETKLATVQNNLADVERRVQQLAATRQQIQDEYQAERTKLLNEEVQRRLTTLTTRTHELQQTLAATTTRVAELTAQLAACGATVPHALTVTDCTTGVHGAEQALTNAYQRVTAAREWLNMVEAAGTTLAAQARARINVVAGPVEIFGDPSLNSTVFDWLIVEGAQLLSEATFVAVARKARRWLLLGEPPLDGYLHERALGRHSRVDFFHRLQAALHTPTWEYDDGRLLCRLYPVHGADRKKLECEPVADSPEIELRLLTLENGPQLAEVAFPATMPPRQAREYLFHELQEITAQPVFRTATWDETPSTITVRFAVPQQPDWATLEGGVREELDGLHTTAVQFDVASGWTRATAEAWANEHLTKRDSGRCVALRHPYRACPGLAQWLNTALGTTYHAPLLGEDEPHVEFLAVPERDRRSRDVGRSYRAGGAGYEIDLNDARQRASLPADLLADLPATGWVNLHEAQAIIRYVENLPSAVTVTAPFPAQVALLRSMAKGHARLRHVKFVNAEQAVHSECDALIVSLTRSHVSRAVTFGDSPTVLTKLLSRVRRHVLFVGDPGTLARRLQWEGPVDHLGAAEAARERRWIAALADCPRVNTQRARAHPESVRV